MSCYEGAMSAELDRIAPTRRPERPASGTQRWRELLFVHWTFPIEEVRRLVPEPLQIDAWDGRGWVGAVPFVMEDIRASWMPRGAELDFLETNLRTYVHHDGVPGVYFFSLEASSWLAVQAARAGWSLPYHHATMETKRTGDRFVYRSSRREMDGASFYAEWELGEVLGASAPGTLEHFLLERYVLYSLSRTKRLMQGRVHHVPYPAQRARVTRIEQDLVAAAGFGLERGCPPETVHYAEGVDVEVFGPWPVDQRAFK